MSYKRKQKDHQKNNYVAKHDFNKGGFHEKTEKQTRGNKKSELNQICLNDFREDYNEHSY